LLVDRSSFTQPLRSLPIVKRLSQESSGLLHGPLLGDMTPTSVRFWVRTLKESVVGIRVDARGNFQSPTAVGKGRSVAGDDFTAVVEVGGLAPGTQYRYQVFIDDRPVPRQQEWVFQTFPPDEAGAPVRLALGGCAKYFPDHERMWDTIRLRRPDAFMILGDNVYMTLPERTGPFQDYSYYQRQSRPEFRRLTASVPVFAIWDDHDAGMDDAFLGPYTDKPLWKVDYLKVFRRNWNNPSSGAEPQRPGVWHSFRAGPVECFMLDGRYYRENYLKDNPSMLGPEQKAWLFRALRESTAPFKLLVSPVPWSDEAKFGVDPDGTRISARDLWSGYREEREEIYEFLYRHGISGVMLVSSDRHRSDVRLNHRPRGYPLYEIESGWLTNEVGIAGSGNPLFEYTEMPSFGLLSFDSTGSDPGAKMEIINIEGDSVFQRHIRLSELRD
jgi:alkaline phosphatase D